MSEPSARERRLECELQEKEVDGAWWNGFAWGAGGMLLSQLLWHCAGMIR